MWLLILLGLSSSVAPPVRGSAIAGGGVRPTVRATVVAVLTVLVGHGVVEVAVVASSPTLLLLLLLGLVLLAVISWSKTRISKSVIQIKSNMNKKINCLNYLHTFRIQSKLKQPNRHTSWICEEQNRTVPFMLPFKPEQDRTNSSIYWGRLLRYWPSSPTPSWSSCWACLVRHGLQPGRHLLVGLHQQIHQVSHYILVLFVKKGGGQT